KPHPRRSQERRLFGVGTPTGGADAAAEETDGRPQIGVRRPQFEPHAMVVGAISLTESEAPDMLNKACEGLKAYTATLDKVATGTFFYQCIFLLLHPTPQVNFLIFPPFLVWLLFIESENRICSDSFVCPFNCQFSQR
ncbi:cyclic phosphodiesterase, partial [Phtheirospermum japonicum]